MNKKVTITSLVALGVAGSLMFGGINPVLASTSGTGNYPSLIQTLIDKFKLNKNEVTNVINTERATRQSERLALIEEKLNQAVKDGKISNEAKDAILSTVKEHQAERSALSENMRTKMEEHREEMQNLEEKYGIDLSEIIGFGGFGMRGSNGMGRGQGMGSGMGRW